MKRYLPILALLISGTAFADTPYLLRPGVDPHIPTSVTGIRFANGTALDTVATTAQAAALLTGGTGTLNLGGFTLSLTAAQLSALLASNNTFTGTNTLGTNGTAVALHRAVTATLSGGSVTISDSNITATSRCTPTNEPAGYSGSIGIPYVSAQAAGSVTISSSNSSATNGVSVTIEN